MNIEGVGSTATLALFSDCCSKDLEILKILYSEKACCMCSLKYIKS